MKPERFRLFKAFLKNEGAWKSYKKNLYADEQMSPYAFYRDIGVYNLIGSAFSWSGTTEGYNYWQTLRIKFDNLLDALREQ